jgi:hypothetical protein
MALAPLVLLDESGDELGDEILLAPGQSDGLLEDALQLANGSRAASFNKALAAEDVFDPNAERFCESGEHLGARRRRGGFPVGDGFGGDADGGCKLGLANCGSFSQGDETSSLLGTRPGETTRHARIVGVHFRIPLVRAKNALALYLVYQVQVTESIGYVERCRFRLTAFSRGSGEWRE